MQKEQRSLAAHILYMPDHKFWHLFYFDNHDESKFRNHWKFGTHIHYVSYLWPELNMNLVWQKVMSGDLSFQNKLHINFGQVMKKISTIESQIDSVSI